MKPHLAALTAVLVCMLLHTAAQDTAAESGAPFVLGSGSSRWHGRDEANAGQVTLYEGAAADDQARLATNVTLGVEAAQSPRSGSGERATAGGPKQPLVAGIGGALRRRRMQQSNTCSAGGVMLSGVCACLDGFTGSGCSTPTQAAGLNLALGRPATASSVAEGAAKYAAAQAVDGTLVHNGNPFLTVAGWTGGADNWPWIMIDLGQAYVLSSVWLYGFSGGFSQFQIFTSPTAMTWTASSGQGGAGMVITSSGASPCIAGGFTPPWAPASATAGVPYPCANGAPARFVALQKFVLNTGSGAGNMQLNEIQIYAASSYSVTPPPPPPAIATAPCSGAGGGFWLQDQGDLGYCLAYSASGGNFVTAPCSATDPNQQFAATSAGGGLVTLSLASNSGVNLNWCDPPLLFRPCGRRAPVLLFLDLPLGDRRPWITKSLLCPTCAGLERVAAQHTLGMLAILPVGTAGRPPPCKGTQWFSRGETLATATQEAAPSPVCRTAWTMDTTSEVPPFSCPAAQRPIASPGSRPARCRLQPRSRSRTSSASSATAVHPLHARFERHP